MSDTDDKPYGIYLSEPGVSAKIVFIGNSTITSRRMSEAAEEFKSPGRPIVPTVAPAPWWKRLLYWRLWK